MLTILILLILAFAVYTGARRGLVLQLVYSIGYLASFLVARHYYQDLAPKLELFIPYPSATIDSKLVFFDETLSLSLDQAFYAGVSFLVILLAGILVTRFIGIFFHSLTFLPLVHQLNWLGGGLLSFVVTYVAVFLLLYLLSLVPLDFIQSQFESSSLAHWMVEKTPIFSKQMYDLWITKMIHS